MDIIFIFGRYFVECMLFYSSSLAAAVLRNLNKSFIRLFYSTTGEGLVFYFTTSCVHNIRVNKVQETEQTIAPSRSYHHRHQNTACVRLYNGLRADCRRSRAVLHGSPLLKIPDIQHRDHHFSNTLGHIQQSTHDTHIIIISPQTPRLLALSICHHPPV